MANILGTIISVGDFLKEESAQINIDYSGDSHELLTLEQGREYSIPDYQREIRWLKEHVIELISDISKGEKFLGNIILNKRPNKKYEVIDGQQRITVLLMIIHYIRSKFGDAIDVIDTCKLTMVNFEKFDVLMKNDFDFESLNIKVQDEIDESDVFNQRFQYHTIWKLFEDTQYFKFADDCSSLLDNIKKSQINIILNTNDTQNYSINYFLDVNLKGVKLDVEDIFKGYLFSMDSSDEIRNEWKKFKILSFQLNKKINYSTTKLLEHFFYCDLYKQDKYKNIKFRQDFLIYECEIDGKKRYDGEHIIKVIQNKTYMINFLKSINIFIDYIINVVENESPNDEFKKMFKIKIDHDETTVIHNIIKKIMLDTNVVPKMLVMKYITEVITISKPTKDDYRKIYGVYLLAVMFTLFESKKNLKEIIGAVKDKQWSKKILEHSMAYFSNDKISKSKITVQYRIIEEGENDNNKIDYQKYRCKSLATIYNYFKLSNEKVTISNMKGLKEYVSDSKKYSIEHFIVNDCGTYRENQKEIPEDYPKEIKKYRNSLFNFIFINEELNKELDNYVISEKIKMIKEFKRQNKFIIDCDYSNMIIERCLIDFKNGINEEDFIEQFSNYASQIIKSVGNKIGIKKQ